MVPPSGPGLLDCAAFKAALSSLVAWNWFHLPNFEQLLALHWQPCLYRLFKPLPSIHPFFCGRQDLHKIVPLKIPACPSWPALQFLFFICSRLFLAPYCISRGFFRGTFCPSLAHQPDKTWCLCYIKSPLRGWKKHYTIVLNIVHSSPKWSLI